MSRRRKSVLLILVVLFLALLVAAWLQPVSPLRTAYDQIRVGMSAVQVAEVLERCGWRKYPKPVPPELLNLEALEGKVGGTYLSLFGFGFSDTGIRAVNGNYRDILTYQGADGDTLTMIWEGPVDGDLGPPLFAEGHVIGKEYHSGAELNLRALWDRLRGMLNW
jgi:hypothetical protein